MSNRNDKGQTAFECAIRAVVNRRALVKEFSPYKTESYEYSYSKLKLRVFTIEGKIIIRNAETCPEGDNIWLVPADGRIEINAL